MDINEEPRTSSRRTGLETVAQMMERFSAAASAAICFGTPVKIDDRTIIPVAEVVAGFGAGGGGGEGKQEPERGVEVEEGKASGSGEGAGGGGFSRARPVAAVIVSPEGVTVEPVVDATQIAMAGVAAAAFLGFWFVRMQMITSAALRKEKTPSLKSIAGALKRM